MANLGIVGYGIVGKATDYGFRKDNNIVFYDNLTVELILALY